MRINEYLILQTLYCQMYKIYIVILLFTQCRHDRMVVGFTAAWAINAYHH